MKPKMIIATDSLGITEPPLTLPHDSELKPHERIAGLRTLVRDDLCIQGGISSPAVIEEPLTTNDAAPK